MLEDIRLAFQGIWSHKLRSALTMLGIIIGIGSIIAIVSTIKGTNEQIKKNLVGAGNNAVNIQLAVCNDIFVFDIKHQVGAITNPGDQCNTGGHNKDQAID